MQKYNSNAKVVKDNHVINNSSKCKNSNNNKIKEKHHQVQYLK